MTPAVAKAPWYFLGLQELLVYFDPWIAGVILPGMIIVGLMAIPYLDPNPKGVGSYNYRDRKFVWRAFLFGFIMWFVLIIFGTFFSGDDWQFYWPWEDFFVHKELIAEKLFTFPLPVGILVLSLYYGLGFYLPTKIKSFKGFIEQLGTTKYAFTMFFLLTMIGVPVKVFLRLLFNVRYILETPWFNI